MKRLILIGALSLAPWTGAFAQPARPISIDVIASFDYPGEGNSTSAQGINDQGDVTGNYVDANGVTRGFIRYSDGTFSAPIVEPNDADGFTFPAPIDPRNSIDTFLSGINEQGFIVGRYTDKAQVTHGLLLTLPRSFLSFDFPGATFTSTSGINNRGEVTGRYLDASGLFHSYVGRVRFGR